MNSAATNKGKKEMLSQKTIEALKKVKCEFCKVSVCDYYDLESEPDNFPDFIPDNWYCSQFCYEKEDESNSKRGMNE